MVKFLNYSGAQFQPALPQHLTVSGPTLADVLNARLQHLRRKRQDKQQTDSILHDKNACAVLCFLFLVERFIRILLFSPYKAEGRTQG